MFRKEVQEKFQKAGWFEGRDVKSVFDKINGFDKFPEFLKEFFYEYGDLDVKTLTKYSDGNMDFKAITKGIYKLDGYLSKMRHYGNVFTFPIAYYPLENASLECDAEGRVYMVGDYECLVSNDFKTGIEKVIMEDYSDTLEWNPETKQWVDEY